MKHTKLPVEIEATQWFKNGDHPNDGNPGTEGGLVRRYRHPNISGRAICRNCPRYMHDHGWIDTLEGGHIVCPGDWVITGVQGENYPCKPDIFKATYQLSDSANTEVEPITREEFEAWASEPPREWDLDRFVDTGKYWQSKVQAAWEAVQWAGADIENKTGIRDQIMQDICDHLPDGPEHERTVCINYERLYEIVSKHLGAATTLARTEEKK